MVSSETATVVDGSPLSVVLGEGSMNVVDEEKSEVTRTTLDSVPVIDRTEVSVVSMSIDELSRISTLDSVFDVVKELIMEDSAIS